MKIFTRQENEGQIKKIRGNREVLASKEEQFLVSRRLCSFSISSPHEGSSILQVLVIQKEPSLFKTDHKS